VRSALDPTALRAPGASLGALRFYSCLHVHTGCRVNRHGVNVSVSVCVLLFCLLYVAVCSTSLVCAVRSVTKTLAREQTRGTNIRRLGCSVRPLFRRTVEVLLLQTLRAVRAGPYCLARTRRLLECLALFLLSVKLEVDDKAS